MCQSMCLITRSPDPTILCAVVAQSFYQHPPELESFSGVENGRRLSRIFDFEHLDQVSEQWLKETCPRQYLTSDAAARHVSRTPSHNSEGSSGLEENG